MFILPYTSNKPYRHFTSRSFIATLIAGLSLQAGAFALPDPCPTGFTSSGPLAACFEILNPESSVFDSVIAANVADLIAVTNSIQSDYLVWVNNPGNLTVYHDLQLNLRTHFNSIQTAFVNIVNEYIAIAESADADTCLDEYRLHCVVMDEWESVALRELARATRVFAEATRLTISSMPVGGNSSCNAHLNADVSIALDNLSGLIHVLRKSRRAPAATVATNLQALIPT